MEKKTQKPALNIARWNRGRLSRLYILIGMILSMGMISSPLAAPAFPGAEGYGADALGGRGGKVIQVTNLDDDGSGSLRAAIGATGPRIVVFRVSGTIALKSDLTITNPNITIAGQSAPGDGVCLKGYKFMISANDVVVRYLRVRRGRVNEAKDDALAIDGAENVIVDHCSISWGCDETLNTWHGAKNISVQWCIISEALHHNSHGFAATLGGVNASYHHNLIANCPGRNPSIAGNNEFQTINMDFRNSVIFNFGYRTFDGKPNSINVVNNYFKPGPNSTQKLFVKIDDLGGYSKITRNDWYLSGNVWEGNESISKDNASGATGATGSLVDKPNPFAPVNTVSAEEAYEMVLADVGARLPTFDPVDTRIIEEVKTGKTTFGKGVVLRPSDVGGWPELKSTEPPVDTDKDGMPDTWEKEKGLNPNSDADGATDRNGDGYTNVEEYLNGLIPDNQTAIRNRGRSYAANRNSGLSVTVNSNGLGRLSLSGQSAEGSFEIFKRNGQLLFQGWLDNGRGEFDAGLWPTGAYVIRVGKLVEKWIQLKN